METMTQNAAVICGVMLAAELTARLCPKDKMLGFVKSLVVLTLLASGAAGRRQRPPLRNRPPRKAASAAWRRTCSGWCGR